jgi:lipopolysaccharide export system permease protein
MRLLQRYILWELLKVFAFLLSVLTILLVFVGVFREVSESGLGPLQILQILPFIVPSLLPFTIPATLLLSVCVVYGRIAGDQEITAAKAAGINVLSLLWPAFLFGGLMSVGSMILTDQTIPWAVANIQRTVASAMEDIFLDMLRTHHQVTDEKQGFSINVMGVRGKTLIKPTFQYSPQGHRPVTIQAAEARLVFDLEQRQVVLHLTQAHIDAPGQRNMWFREADYPFPLPEEIREPKARHMSVHDIQKKMNGLGDALRVQGEAHASEAAMALLLGDFDRLIADEFVVNEWAQEHDASEYRKLRTEIFSRFSMSLSCFFFVLVGGPFAILQGRRQFLTSFFMCFLPILLGYYPVAMLMMNLSKAGTVDPAYAMWLGNLFLGLAGLYTLRKVLRH